MDKVEYPFSDIEKRWQSFWDAEKSYKVEIDPSRPKYYVLDMFPYPSGAGLHVGHPLGYIASDIYARFKRHRGFNVLHPMGYDAFGLPAEQYAIQTGQHPAVTTERNIKRYRDQLKLIGLSFDWDRELATSDPEYYHWTQWAFIQMFHHYYDTAAQKARPIADLVAAFERTGTEGVTAATGKNPLQFGAGQWSEFSEQKKLEILLDYRIAYLGDAVVNWCSKLGTVLANDEVKDGISLRGGHPVEQVSMKQWQLRISPYAQRLLDGLEKLDWSTSIKEMQRNWFGRSEGAEIEFRTKDGTTFVVYTTRPDTLWGVTFMVLAPESDLVDLLTTDSQRAAVDEYQRWAKKRTERERLADTNKTGVFTGAYAIHPFSGEEIPVWIGDYIIAGYGTGAIMGVPAHDQRDYEFATRFSIPIREVISGGDISEAAFESHDGIVVNSDFITGLTVSDAIQRVTAELEKLGIGTRKVNFRLRDAIFSRQRYWGEPFPIYYRDGHPFTLSESELPLKLPEVDAYLPTEKGEPPLGRARNWKTADGFPLELTTMPGFAGSSAYYLRYTDPRNSEVIASRAAMEYWGNVDIYFGGAEHATGHLVYSRFWCMFLYDIGVVNFEEPFKKLFNQGMIQGRSNTVYRKKGTNTFVSLNLVPQHDVTPIRVDVNLVENDILDTERFRAWNPEYKDAEFLLEDGKYVCGHAVEKMSKSLFNVVSPDDVAARYGADTLRVYEMFLGPVEQSKPWDTKGIEGSQRFLRKLWRLYHDESFKPSIQDREPQEAEYRTLHKAIKKVTEDIERLSFNTAVSALMICVNELTAAGCSKRKVLEPLAVLIAPFAPHLAEELWHVLGYQGSVTVVSFPEADARWLVETTFTYPVSVNGKKRFEIELSRELSAEQIREAVLESPSAQSYLADKAVKNVVIVPNRIVNIVL